MSTKQINKKGLCALVPFKSVSLGKQRLALTLTAPLRERLVSAMLFDTLSALAQVPSIDQLILLTNESSIPALNSQFPQLRWMIEHTDANSLNSAVQFAADSLAEEFETLLVVHGDLPLLNTAELEQMIDQHNGLGATRRLSLVPDAVENGSNCLLCSPANLMPFHYGQQSYSKHLAQAAQLNNQYAANKEPCIAVQSIALPSASLDIDEMADLQLLQQLQGQLPETSLTASVLLVLKQQFANSTVLDRHDAVGLH